MGQIGDSLKTILSALSLLEVPKVLPPSNDNSVAGRAIRGVLPAALLHCVSKVVNRLDRRACVG